ncbi:hypothetical protein KQI83_15460 [Roseburia sp. MSJ-14]|nr:hypothetical protein [Roseburia sp. MSJ-14]MBU5474867.1 hypothetical protein [Roseburia sp. MSJ-14]
MNPAQLFQFMNAWKKFTSNHPKSPKFLRAITNDGITEGTIIEINVTTPEGKNYCSNLKITSSDLELLQQIKKSVS